MPDIPSDPDAHPDQGPDETPNRVPDPMPGGQPESGSDPDTRPVPSSDQPTSRQQESASRSFEGQIPGRVEPDPHTVMSFGDHLEDLRRRVMFALLGLLPIFAIAFLFGRDLLGLLIAPAQRALIAGGQDSSLLATGPFETFGTVVHLAVVVTVLVGAPWVLYHLWMFISPGLYAHERRFVNILLPFSGLLVIASVAFMYLAILPVVLAFFVGFSAQIESASQPTAPLPPGIELPIFPMLEADPDTPPIGSAWINSEIWQLRFATADPKSPGDITIKSIGIVESQGVVQQYRISEYVKTLLNLALGFGAAFQTPVVIVMLGWVGIIDPRKMSRYRRYAIGVCTLIGAFLTPADPVSMMLMAGPLYLLYELGLLTLRVMPAERVLGKIKEPADAGDA
ncbi:MAG: twin-arginine translocase subunit TatC [Phycisphaerales bacterium]